MDEVGKDKRAAREAADWLARLNARAVSTEELGAFYEWRRDPANAEAYARGEQAWHDARALGDDHDIAEAVREALERPRLQQGRHLTRRAMLAGGGAVAALAAGGAWWLVPRAGYYRTQVGEQLLVQLDDGSRMRLNTNSEARAVITDRRREVELVRGQALFEVAHDPGRPFRVRHGKLDVEALGTSFEVAMLDDVPVRILLIEGRIAVGEAARGWRRELDYPGSVLSVDEDGLPRLSEEDIELATSWTTGRLAFRGTPLGAAVVEVNRYSRTQLRLDAPEHAGLEVDGIFETGDPDAFVAAVTAIYPLSATRRGELILLTGR